MHLFSLKLNPTFFLPPTPTPFFWHARMELILDISHCKHNLPARVCIIIKVDLNSERTVISEQLYLRGAIFNCQINDPPAPFLRNTDIQWKFGIVQVAGSPDSLERKVERSQMHQNQLDASTE